MTSLRDMMERQFVEKQGRPAGYCGSFCAICVVVPSHSTLYSVVLSFPIFFSLAALQPNISYGLTDAGLKLARQLRAEGSAAAPVRGRSNLGAEYLPGAQPAVSPPAPRISLQTAALLHEQSTGLARRPGVSPAAHVAGTAALLRAGMLEADAAVRASARKATSDVDQAQTGRQQEQQQPYCSLCDAVVATVHVCD